MLDNKKELSRWIFLFIFPGPVVYISILIWILEVYEKMVDDLVYKFVSSVTWCSQFLYELLGVNPLFFALSCIGIYLFASWSERMGEEQKKIEDFERFMDRED